MQRVGDIMSEASALGDVERAALASWSWATDIETRDHEFLVRVNLLPALRRVEEGASISGLAATLARRTDEAAAALAAETRDESELREIARGSSGAVRGAAAAARALGSAGGISAGPVFKTGSSMAIAAAGSAAQSRADLIGAAGSDWRPWRLDLLRKALT